MSPPEIDEVPVNPVTLNAPPDISSPPVVAAAEIVEVAVVEVAVKFGINKGE